MTTDNHNESEQTNAPLAARFVPRVVAEIATLFLTCVAEIAAKLFLTCAAVRFLRSQMAVAIEIAHPQKRSPRERAVV